MLYPFYCKSCNFHDDYIFSVDTLPEIIVCPKCEEDMKQDFSLKLKTLGIKIPYNFKALDDNNLKYDADSTVDVGSIVKELGMV